MFRHVEAWARPVSEPVLGLELLALASTAGRSISLASYRGHVVVLYFSEGIGCDACFYQMREFENHAAELAAPGITCNRGPISPLAWRYRARAAGSGPAVPGAGRRPAPG